MTEAKSGQCLCGAVKLEFDVLPKETGCCHCSMCRRWTSGPMFALDVGSNVKITGQESISEYQSSDWAKRGFCSKCGTNLYYLLLPTGEYHISVGLLDEGTQLQFQHQIFIDEKPDWYAFANETKNMTGAEVFAQHAPPEDAGE